MVTDLTIHPVVNLKVGKYEENKVPHRICEMNEDVYIFHKWGFGEINQAEMWKSGVNEEEIKPGSGVYDLWSTCLKGLQCTPINMKDKLDAPRSHPRPDKWFDRYVSMMDRVAEEGGRLPPIFRELGEEHGGFYLELKDVEQKYIERLETPENEVLHYNDIFEKTRQNVMKCWWELGAAIAAGDKDQFTLANGDLDTGKDEKGDLIFWGK